MAIVGWALFVVAMVLMLFAPALLAVAVVVVLIALAAKRAYKVGPVLGGLVVVVLLGSAASGAYVLMYAPLSAFKQVCNFDGGAKVIRAVTADSYVLVPSAQAQWDGMSIEEAVDKVARKRVTFVEVRDSVDPQSASAIHARYGLDRFRNANGPAGYFRLRVGERGSDACRWLMPADVAQGWSSYSSYISQRWEHDANKPLRDPAKNKECVAVDYVPAPASPYTVRYVQASVDKFERRSVEVIETGSKEKVAEAVLYVYDPKGYFPALAAGMTYGNLPAECPQGITRTDVVKSLLRVR